MIYLYIYLQILYIIKTKSIQIIYSFCYLYTKIKNLLLFKITSNIQIKSIDSFRIDFSRLIGIAASIKSIKKKTYQINLSKKIYQINCSGTHQHSCIEKKNIADHRNRYG